MSSKSALNATEKRPHQQSARGNDKRSRLRRTHVAFGFAWQRLTAAISGLFPESALAAEVRLRLLLQRGDSPLRQRCGLGRRIFFLYLLVNLLGFVRLLARLVE